MDSVFAPSNTAVITGGASGIGLALAAKCKAAGMTVLIADRNAEMLEKARTTLGEENLVAVEMDVANVEHWAKMKDKVAVELAGEVPIRGFAHASYSLTRLVGKINLLVLNAGIGPKSNWDDLASFHAIIDINLFGVVNGINAMLPQVKQAALSSGSAVVITGSKQGITNPPGNPAYNASKAAVKVIAEHLSYDLKDSPTAVHLLVPGWTFTGLSGGAPGSDRPKPAGAWSPDQVVDFLQEKMTQGTFYVICPDNEVTEEVDRKRMLWSVGDAVYDRPPLSRWRDEWKGTAQDWMSQQKI